MKHAQLPFSQLRLKVKIHSLNQSIHFSFNLVVWKMLDKQSQSLLQLSEQLLLGYLHELESKANGMPNSIAF